ncbi:hypothetical protein RJT34_11548 [Clitoria ternatea]|uniref:DRBM domain-containing protein n=1 Tax=Clitoria ternatea TaxID=43366 RepID=A0AAN9JK55_CLITE
MMHKNRLQEFAQKSNIALPVYQTFNEGQQHAPKFRCTVYVNGMSYTSQSTFSWRRTAEQEVARLALECLSKRTRDEGSSLVFEISMFCKSILNEYATKLNLERPIYNTLQKGLLPVFVSSLIFNGTSYTGDAARNKKDAEQLAARAAILSILGILFVFDVSGSGTMLYEMIKSKSILYGAIKPKDSQVILASNNDQTKIVGSVAGNNDQTKIELPKSSRMVSSCQEFQMPKRGSSREGTKFSNVSLQPCSALPIGDGSNLKKRRKK